MVDRRTSKPGHALITIDVRQPGADTARGIDASTLARTVLVLSELLQPDDVFFDFGVVSLRNVDLDALAERLAPTP